MSSQPNGSHPDSKGRIKLVHIYPREMSIYGDLGNTRCLASRLRWHGCVPSSLATSSVCSRRRAEHGRTAKTSTQRSWQRRESEHAAVPGMSPRHGDRPVTLRLGP